MSQLFYIPTVLHPIRLFFILSLLTQSIVAVGARAEIVLSINPQETPFLLSLNVICSATLVSPHVVLTAGHCAFDRSFTKVISENVGIGSNPKFNDHNGKFRATLAAYKFKNWKMKPTNSVISSEDWAIYILDQPILLEKYPPLLPYEKVRELRGTNVAAYGYPMGKKQFRSKTIHTAIRAIRSKFLKISGVLQKGQSRFDANGLSGGPVIVTEGPFKNYYAGATSMIDAFKNVRVSYAKEFYEKASQLIAMDSSDASPLDLLLSANQQ